MKKLFSFFVLCGMFVLAKAGCGCGQMNGSFTLTGNYTYDTINQLYYINAGDTLLFSNSSHVCGGTGSEANFYLNDSIYNGMSGYGYWYMVKLYKQGTYRSTSDCMFGAPTVFTDFEFTIAFNNALGVSDLNNSNKAVNFIYSHSAKQLLLKAHNLNQQSSQLFIYDLLGKHTYHQTIQFEGTEDNVVIDLSGSLPQSGLYLVQLQTQEQNFTYKLHSY